MRILKYNMEKSVNSWFEIEMPKCSQFLDMQLQPSNMDFVMSGLGIGGHCGSINAWFLTPDDTDMHKRVFMLVGTGIDFNDVCMKSDDKYLATAQNGRFVWHLFERLK